MREKFTLYPLHTFLKSHSCSNSLVYAVCCPQIGKVRLSLLRRFSLNSKLNRFCKILQCRLWLKSTDRLVSCTTSQTDIQTERQTDKKSKVPTYCIFASQRTPVYCCSDVGFEVFSAVLLKNPVVGCLSLCPLDKQSPTFRRIVILVASFRLFDAAV